MQFVWFYIPAVLDGLELRQSQESVRKFCSGAGEFVVVGEKPSWYKGKFIELPRDMKQRTRVGHTMFPWYDTRRKIMHVASDKMIDEKFVLMMDDTYLIAPTSVEELVSPRYDPYFKLKPVGRPWHQLIARTMSMLSERGATTYQYGTHLPHLFEKRKLRKLFEDFAFDQQLFLFEIAYENVYSRNPKSYEGYFKRILSRPSPSVLRQIDTMDLTVLNTTSHAWSVSFSEWLQRRLDDTKAPDN